MSIITNEMIRHSYKLAKDVYKEIISKDDAVNELSTKYGMNEVSAQNYINDYICMREGKTYKRTMSIKATKYFLDNLYQDDGELALEKALISILKHVEYYEGVTKAKSKGIRLIYEEYNKLLNNDVLYPEEK